MCLQPAVMLFGFSPDTPVTVRVTMGVSVVTILAAASSAVSDGTP